jgi:hypothetical protein
MERIGKAQTCRETFITLGHTVTMLHITYISLVKILLHKTLENKHSRLSWWTAEDQGPQRMTWVSGPTLTFTGSCAAARWQKWAYIEVKNLARFVDLACEILWNHQSLWPTPMMASNYVFFFRSVLVKKPWQSQSATVKQGRLPGRPMIHDLVVQDITIKKSTVRNHIVGAGMSRLT